MADPRQDSTPRLSRSLEQIRAEFPGLVPGTVMLDGAAGTLVPTAVIEAIDDALRHSMANTHGAFSASHRSDETVAAARAAVADLVGGYPDGVVFGPNMTTLTFRFAGILADGWGPGDEIVVSALDHDANIRPWVLAAQRAGSTVKVAEFDPETGELAPETYDELLTDRTRLVAVTAASNLVGTKPDVAAIARKAHAHGALVYVDGVHATSHGPIDVNTLGADFYAFSTYKLFGPHLGVIVAAPELLARYQPQKLIPSPDTVPDRFEYGTPAFELLAGVSAAIDWLASLATSGATRAERAHDALAAVETYLDSLLNDALTGLAQIPDLRLLGHARRRTSTISFAIAGHDPADLAAALSARRIAVWNGDNYAYEPIKRFGLQDAGGAIRASFVLYNDSSDVDALLTALGELAG